MIELRQGPWQTALADVTQVDAVITDPPYGGNTHGGHSRLRNADGSLRRTEIAYQSWSESDVSAFVESWAPRTRGWFCAMTSHDLFPAYARALESCGRYVFAPIPCVMQGMTVRLAGDGPSSWCVWMVVSRPRGKEFFRGALPGAYQGTPPNRGGSAALPILGTKPLWLMGAVLSDYTDPDDLVCDPCAGWGTTALACKRLGRRFIGAEIDLETYNAARTRLTGQNSEPLGKGEQLDLIPKT